MTTEDDTFDVETVDMAEGGRVHLEIQYYRDWLPQDCAAAVTMPSGSTAPGAGAYDEAVTVLRTVSPPPPGGRLGARVVDDELYAGAWTPVRVRVTNSGNDPVRDVRATLRGGEGLQYRRARLGTIAPRSSKTARVRMRATGGAGVRTLRLTVRGRAPGGVTQQSSVVSLTVLKQGRAPRPGRYAGQRPRPVGFAVRGGTVRAASGSDSPPAAWAAGRSPRRCDCRPRR